MELNVETEIENNKTLVENFRLLVTLCLEKFKLANFIIEIPNISSNIELIELTNDWSVLIEIFTQIVDYYSSLKGTY